MTKTSTLINRLSKQYHLILESLDKIDHWYSRLENVPNDTHAAMQYVDWRREHDLRLKAFWSTAKQLKKCLKFGAYYVPRTCTEILVYDPNGIRIHVLREVS